MNEKAISVLGAYFTISNKIDRKVPVILNATLAAANVEMSQASEPPFGIFSKTVADTCVSEQETMANDVGASQVLISDRAPMCVVVDEHNSTSKNLKEDATCEPLTAQRLEKPSPWVSRDLIACIVRLPCY